MKIEKVNMPGAFFNDGLGDIEMKRLADTVIIAGRNGVGKSRMLSRLRHCINNYVDEATEIELRQSIANSIEANEHPATLEKQKENNLLYIHSSEDRLKYQDMLTFDKKYPKYEVIEFVPNELKYAPPEENNPKQLDESYQQCISSRGVDKVGIATYIYIQQECSRYVYATHPDFAEESSEKEKIVESYNHLKGLINEFIATELAFDAKGNAKLFGLPLSKSNLSDGQKVLLQLCVTIHAQKANLNNLILLLDEPENHLHPEALLQYIKSVRSTLKNGQIWIATHSIHLMAAVDTSYIWYMDNGTISYAGQAPEKVLHGLLGDDDEASKLQDFLNLPAELAANHFAAECLLPPDVSGSGAGDTQTNQIWEAIQENIDTDCYKILDCGAGKGRLADAYYFSTPPQEREQIKDKLDYTAFDTDPKYADQCKDAISRIYGQSDHRYYTDEIELISSTPNENYDVVVMCNVLHEIPPTDWVKTFKDSSMITSCLRSNGYLLIVEDLLIPIGERPHKDGYFVLSMVELKLLFNIPHDAKDIVTADANGKKRLMAYLIPKAYLSNISDDTVKEAIRMLHRHAKQEIMKYREDTSYKGGKALAFWTQQLANTTLFLDIG